MGELTKQDVEAALIKVLSDRALMEQTLSKVVEPLIVKVAAHKLETTFGVNCHDPEDREETRKDMEWTRRKRVADEGDAGEWVREDLKFLRKARVHFESEEGQAQLASAVRLFTVIDATAKGFARALVLMFITGVTIIVVIGLTSQQAIKKLLGAFM